MKFSILNRVILLASSLLAAYQIAVGIDDLEAVPQVCYTIGFGVLLVSCLLLLILGYEVLDSQVVVVVATSIPLSISLGMVWEYLPAIRVPYLVFALAGFVAVLITRDFAAGRPATLVLVVVHGIAGLVIFILPVYLSLSGRVNPGFILVGIGGGLIGLGGLLLSFLKMGKPVLPHETIMNLLPGLLLAMTAAFVAGFNLG